MSVIDTLRKVCNHPPNRGQKLNALYRYFASKWYNLVLKSPFTFDFIESSVLRSNPTHQGASMHYVFGLHEWEDMMFVLHFLRSEDLFIDVGANIGAFSILSAKEAGAKTIAFEPHPQTFEELEEHKKLNHLSDDLLQTINTGLSDQEGTLAFAADLGINNHIAYNDSDRTELINVPVQRLDSLVVLDRTTVIKIDVEGYETAVVDGMGDLLFDPNLQVLIIESQGLGSRFGYKEKELHARIEKAGFTAIEYNPQARSIKTVQPGKNGNTIFIRDIDLVQERVRSSRPWSILGEQF